MMRGSSFLKHMKHLFASLFLLLSTPLFAVSLGDELILSRLGDPVEIEIEVLQWEDMDLERVQISAATREEYEVFDLTWLPVLEDLNFNLVGPDLDGDVRVLISSRDPLNEPFLELLLVLRWPGGSLRREYVLLFDPPGARVSVAPAVVAPVVMTVPQLPPTEETAEIVVEEPNETAPPLVEQAALVQVEPAVVDEIPASVAPIPIVAIPEPAPAPIVTEAEQPEPASPTVDEAGEIDAPALPDARTQIAIEVETLAPQAPVVLDTTRRTYQVRSGDSLWNIARQFRPAGAGENLYQMLLSIHNLNRSSFVNGNIALLKANALLQIPSTPDIDTIDAITAEAEFDRRWDQGTQRFDAVQRGEAIPLFANEQPEEPVVEVEDELPPGTEAPVDDSDADALIMVSATNVPQPLRIATEVNDITDVAAPDLTSGANVSQPGSDELEAEPAPVLIQESLAVQTPAAIVESGNAQTPVRVVTRAQFAVELEAELTAMRTRRESAEAVAQQLQASLQQAQAERAAQSSMLGTENLLLASGAALLLVALLAAVVFSLKIAGDLRLRNGTLASPTLESRTEPAWLSAQPAGHQARTERKEPHMPEMEVVELQIGDADATPSRTATMPRGTKKGDDLFARMEDLLGSDTNRPKSS
jgi:FimV-like protein